MLLLLWGVVLAILFGFCVFFYMLHVCVVNQCEAGGADIVDRRLLTRCSWCASKINGETKKEKDRRLLPGSAEARKMMSLLTLHVAHKKDQRRGVFKATQKVYLRQLQSLVFLVPTYRFTH